MDLTGLPSEASLSEELKLLLLLAAVMVAISGRSLLLRGSVQLPPTSRYDVAFPNAGRPSHSFLRVGGRVLEAVEDCTTEGKDREGAEVTGNVTVESAIADSEEEAAERDEEAADREEEAEKRLGGEEGLAPRGSRGIAAVFLATELLMVLMEEVMAAVLTGLLGDRLPRMLMLLLEKLLRRPLMHVLVLLRRLDLFNVDAFVKLFKDSFEVLKGLWWLEELIFSIILILFPYITHTNKIFSSINYFTIREK